MKYAINIHSPQKYKKYIRKAIVSALEYEGVGECEINIEIADNCKIQELNKEYRGKDCPTDVLSFPMNEINPENGKNQLGDVIISIEKAKQQSEELGHSIECELMFLSVHATLHLLGYDHEISEADDAVMREKQKEIRKIYE